MPVGVDRRKGWWGVRYLGSVCDQAGFRFDPTPSDGDVYSLDGQIFMTTTLSVFVQVKCTSRPITRARSYRIRPGWRRNWERLDLPGYFVVVSVPPDTTDWMEHSSKPWTTVLKSAAFWTRIDPLPPDRKSITVKASDRLTVDTLDLWSADLRARAAAYGFGGGTA
ncbi:DUF4365 domain-containing protein [Tetrasphaera sp. F2B08]|uniref:DUF4365 domain-containing protein n=1 Tax=Nostocoides sp. F2B08 TaxID=2653936 RepID=UPI001D0373AE